MLRPGRLSFKARQSPWHATWNRTVRPFGISSSCSCSLRVIATTSLISSTRGGTTGDKVALVQKYPCIQCGRVYIQSPADAVTDNDLDSIRRRS